MSLLRKSLAVWLSVVWAACPGWAQERSIAPVRSSAFSVFRPYYPVDVPPIRLGNSPRLASLVRAGILYLSAEDAIALALENNIDLEIVRYNPLMLEWNLTRARAGGLLPGVPSNASQAGSVASGQGVAGSQQAAGVNIPGSTSGRTQSTNATVSQVGAVTQTLDPIVQESSTFSHTTTVQPNSQQSLTPVLVSDSRAHSASVQQGLLTGGSVTVSFTEHWLNENALTDVLNPSSAPSLSVSVQHNLLQGFGRAVNERTITVARMNLNSSDLSFRNTVVNVVAQVLNSYYTMAASYEDVKAKSLAAETATTFLADVRERARIGTVAPSDVIAPEGQAVSAEEARLLSETSLEQQEIQLKNLLSRDGTADPILRTVRIVPLDPVRVPEREDLASVEQLIALAWANRPDLALEKENEAASVINNLGTRSALLPTGIVFGGVSSAGLAGTPHPLTIDGVTLQAPDSLVGGLGKAMGQVVRFNYPSERVGAAYFTPLRNRQALADYAIDELTLRQTQLLTRKDFNQVQVDVANYVTALRQALARYQAAVQNRILQEQLLAAESRRFQLGASIPYNVTQQQRDLVAAQSSEIAARVAYMTARIALDRTTGTLLTANHVSLEEAREGKVARHR